VLDIKGVVDCGGGGGVERTDEDDDAAAAADACCGSPFTPDTLELELFDDIFIYVFMSIIPSLFDIFVY